MIEIIILIVFIFIKHQAGGVLMAISIVFGAINVNTQSENAGIFLGANNQVGWDSHSKGSNGNGSFSGSNISFNNVNILIDNDLVDSPINDQDVKPGLLNQQV